MLLPVWLGLSADGVVEGTDEGAWNRGAGTGGREMWTCRRAWCSDNQSWLWEARVTADELVL
eukprot:scaffold160840_cov12-Tisochrysis_lutea.AAC.1